MGGLEIYLRCCSGFCLVGLSIGVVSFFYTLNSIGWKDITLSIGNPLNPQNCLVNKKFYFVITQFFFGVCDIIFAIYEAFLIINPVKFGYGTNGFLRALFYCLSGFSVLGVGADLGIASGILILVGAILTIVNTSLIKCDCFRLQATSPNKHQKIEDISEDELNGIGKLFEYNVSPLNQIQLLNDFYVFYNCNEISYTRYIIGMVYIEERYYQRNINKSVHYLTLEAEQNQKKHNLYLAIFILKENMLYVMLTKVFII